MWLALRSVIIIMNFLFSTVILYANCNWWCHNFINIFKANKNIFVYILVRRENYFFSQTKEFPQWRNMHETIFFYGLCTFLQYLFKFYYILLFKCLLFHFFDTGLMRIVLLLKINVFCMETWITLELLIYHFFYNYTKLNVNIINYSLWIYALNSTYSLLILDSTSFVNLQMRFDFENFKTTLIGLCDI